MQHIDLFSGIGGFALAAQAMGWETVQFCELDNYCQKLLAQNFPGVPIHDDVHTLTYETIIENGAWKPNTPTLLTGGFPCQPFSCAGKRMGTSDKRHLWPQMRRLIRELKPKWVVAENVYGIVSWSNGVVFEQVCADLEAEGYAVQPMVLPACGVGAPHRRYRVWFVAHLVTRRLHDRLAASGQNQQQAEFTQRGKEYDVYAHIQRHPQYALLPKPAQKAQYHRSIDTAWSNPEAVPEPAILRVAHGVSERIHRIKALGNAIVPQVARQLFEAIHSYNQLIQNP